jgi:hypothetical protein
MVGVAAGGALLLACWWIVRRRREFALMRRQMEDLGTQARNARSTRDAVGELIGSMTGRPIS